MRLYIVRGGGVERYALISAVFISACVLRAVPYLRRRSDAVPVRALIRDIIAVCRIVSDLSDIFIYLVSSD